MLPFDPLHTEDHLFWRDCVGSLGKLVKILELVIFHELGAWHADRLALSNLWHKQMVLCQIWVHCPLSLSQPNSLNLSPLSVCQSLLFIISYTCSLSLCSSSLFVKLKFCEWFPYSQYQTSVPTSKSSTSIFLFLCFALHFYFSTSLFFFFAF